MKSNGEYDWSFSVTGGTLRVNLSNGQDIMHLDELDQKLWTVLSCPVDGLEMDSRTLSILDADGDGHIHASDIIRTVQWLKPIIKDPEYLLRGDSYIPLSLFNRDTEEGDAIFLSASLILNLLGLDHEYISTENIADPEIIYRTTEFNGDGVITLLSTEDECLKQTMADAEATIGTVRDRSGNNGLNSELINKFYASLHAYSQWRQAGEDDRENVFQFGDDTEKVYHSFMAIKEKVDDWFMRCSLASFDSSSTPVLDTSASRIQGIRDRNLAGCRDEIADCPLAKVTPTGILSFEECINPVWKEPLDTFKEAVSFKGDTLSNAQWKAISGKLSAYQAWMVSKKGEEIESLGYERIKVILQENRQEALTELVKKDLEYAVQSENIRKVCDLLYIYRDFYRFLKNYITFKDFYNPEHERTALFQAGSLYIDQRCCDLCIRVQDIGRHSSMASLSEMYLMYCDCVSKQTSEKMTVVVAVTDGSTDDLREGKNGIFYDNDGMDWDATIVRIIDNPISIREAFWTPYRRLGNFVSESVSKLASRKESEVMEKGMADIENASEKITTKEKSGGSPSAQSFDVAKFAGLFAMIGMALGTILGFILDLFNDFAKLTLLQMCLVLIGLILVISGPSMLKAWIKLRKRNIAPLLNANGWAINSRMLISVSFGQTLTSLAKYPLVVTSAGKASKKKRTPWYLTAILLLIVILGIAITLILFQSRDIRNVEKRTAAPAPTEQVTEQTGQTD